MLFFGSPELLVICIFGISIVATLSGNAPLKGLAAALIGLQLSMIGEDSQTGTLCFTFDTLYLWTGIPIDPVAPAVFAIPELYDLMINRSSITSGHRTDALRGQWPGLKDAFTGQQRWGDIITLLTLRAVAWTMEPCGWPRPPLVLGFILGTLIERYTLISVQRHVWNWLTSPFVQVMFSLGALSIVQKMLAGRGSGRRIGHLL